MAEQPEQDPNQVLSIFPDPPAFWKDFIPENVSRYAVLKKAHAKEQKVGVKSVIRVPNVPPELTYLNPPAEPAEGTWKNFAEQLQLEDNLPSLEDAGIPRLVPAVETDRDGKHADRAFELKRLAKSLILNYLELMGTMATNPAQGRDKVNDVRTLFLNFHHTLNEYRPHQARESLIAMMQDQLDNKRAETAAVRGVTERAKALLEGLNSMGISAPDENQKEAKSDASGAHPTNRASGVHKYENEAIAALDADFS